MQGAGLTDRQRQFAEDNHKLIYSFLQQYNFPCEEWYDVAAIGFCKAVREFNPKRSRTFSNFAYHVMLNDVRQEMRKARNPKRKAVLVSLQSETCDGCFLDGVLANAQYSVENSSMLEVMDFIRSMKKEHQLVITLLAAGQTQTKIADKIGVSQVRVSRYVKEIRAKFRNEFLCREGTVHV